MALATQCPHCHTTFRVASDQLKLRGGIVRCGTCQRIFDGSAHLIDLEALAARKAAEAAGTTAEAPSPGAPQPAQTPPAAELPAPDAPARPEPEAAEDANDSAPPVYTLDFDHTFDPFGILPKVEPALDAAPPQPDEAEAETEAATEAVEADRDALPPETGVQAEAELPAVADTQPEPPQEHVEPEPGPQANEDAAVPAPEAEPEPQPEPQPTPEPELQPVPAQAYAPAGRIEPSFDLPVDEELVAQPLPGHEPEPEPGHAAETDHAAAAEAPAAAPSQPAPLGRSLQTDIPPSALPLRASADIGAPLHPPHIGAPQAAARSARAKTAEARARRSKMTPTRIEPPRLRMPAESDEPEFVKRSRRQEQSGRLVRILMGAGAAILLLLLAAQLLLTFRNELAVRQPGMRPLLSGLCSVAGCRVGLPAQAENLVIDEGELATLGPDTYSLNTQLRNQGNLALAWPSIELELTDANNKPVLRRVFGPADYLPPGTPVAAGFGAHAEQPVRLNFALADLKPSGYHTFVFYP